MGSSDWSKSHSHDHKHDLDMQLFPLLTNGLTLGGFLLYHGAIWEVILW